MLEQELKEIWKTSSQAEKIKFETSRLMLDLNQKTNHFEKGIRNRDIREIGASVFGILLFGYFAYEIPFLLTRIASILGVLWFVYVIYRFKNVKKHKLPTDLSLSFKEQLENQKKYTTQEAKLLDTVLYWYVLPPLAMNILFIIGLGNPVEYDWQHVIFSKLLPLSLNMKLFTLFGIVLLNSFIVWINKRAVQKEFNPFIAEIEKVIFQLGSEN
jgi:hypothetical protein